MNLRDQRKKYYLSVKKLITVWQAAGMKGLGILLSDPNNIIEKDSWVEKVKRLYQEKKYLSLDAELALVSNMFNFKENGREEINKDQGNKDTDRIPGGTHDSKDGNSGPHSERDG